MSRGKCALHFHPKLFHVFRKKKKTSKCISLKMFRRTYFRLRGANRRRRVRRTRGNLLIFSPLFPFLFIRHLLCRPPCSRFFLRFIILNVENAPYTVPICVAFRDTNIIGTRREARVAPAGSLCKRMLMSSTVMTDRKYKNIFFYHSDVNARSLPVRRYHTESEN